MCAIQIFHNFTIQLLFNSLNVPWQRLNNKIKNIHERALRIVYQDKKSSFKILVKRDKSMSIHMKNLQYLATKLFIELPFSGNHERNFIFQENETYNLRSGNHLAQKNIQTTQYRIESVSNVGTKLWNLLPGEIKNSSSFTVLKNKIRKLTPEKCPCKLCQTYIKNDGYIWLLLDIC